MGSAGSKSTRLWDVRYPFMGKVPVYGKDIATYFFGVDIKEVFNAQRLISNLKGTRLWEMVGHLKGTQNKLTY